MSRYRKVVTGKVELPEIDGNKFLIYPTMETRMELLELVKAMQTVDEIDTKDDNGNVIETRRARGVNFRMKNISETCASIIYEGCWDHSPNGKRLNLQIGEEDASYDNILALVVQGQPITVLSEICMALGIFDKEIVKKYKEQEKSLQKKDVGEVLVKTETIKPDSPSSSSAKPTK